MAHSKLSVTLVESSQEVYEISKSRNVSHFNFRQINHHSHGKLTYVYPGGTIGGGHIGIVPKTMARKVGVNPEVIDYRLENGSVVMDLVVPTIPTEKPNAWVGCLWGVVILFFISLIVGTCSGDSEKSKGLTEQEKIDSHFSGWDGSHRELVKSLKANLKDPDSFEHIETTYKVQGDTIWVFMNYRAKNSFGGYVVEGVTAITDKNTGRVIELIKQE